jgi:O-6-methylguanine DNA methyltransferase
VAGIHRHVVRVRLDDDGDALRAELREEHPNGVFKRGSAVTMEAVREIRAYLDGGPDPELDVVVPDRGFHSRVWRHLRRIPRGRVRTYGGVAKALRNPGAARAVGQACRGNPLPIVLPCHRVVAADLSIGGFTGGVAMKRALLELEGARIRG